MEDDLALETSGKRKEIFEIPDRLCQQFFAHSLLFERFEIFAEVIEDASFALLFEFERL